MQTAYRFQLLAPSAAAATKLCTRVVEDPESYQHYMDSLQVLRGQTYFADRAIQPEQLDSLGRFAMEQDEDCWHFLLVNTRDEVIGCVRYLIHAPDVRVEELWIGRSSLAFDPVWSSKLRQAVNAELQLARQEELAFIEIGGWAIASDIRHTRASIEVLLASFALARFLGGAIGCCTATFRNNSASILRRMGGKALRHGNEDIPPYDDRKYGCTMEVLRFHFQSFDPRYEKTVNYICKLIEQSTVTTPSSDRLESLNRVVTWKGLRAMARALNSEQHILAPDVTHR